MRNSAFLVVGILMLCLVLLSRAPVVEAATLSGASATITTSRPSASTPISGDHAAGSTQATIMDNGSIFLASDSAQFRSNAVQASELNLNVASMSAANTPSASRRIVFFTNAAGTTLAHAGGTALVVPITSMHTLQFTTVNSIPASGKIILTYPTLSSTDANNAASPSATTFQMNGLSSSTIKITQGTTDVTTSKFTGGISITNPSGGSAPVITLTVQAGQSLAAGSTIRVFLGCTTVSATPACTAQNPLIINPTKTAAAGTGDSWSIGVKTQDNNSADLDSATVRLVTIDSVTVQAIVEPTLTFTIAGVADATTLNASYTTGCTNTSPDVTNTGIAATATNVNLGIVNTSKIQVGAQDLTVSTNAVSGFTITATSSGKLINPSTGYFFYSDTVGTTMAAGTEQFGIHPCGTYANTTLFTSSSVLGGSGKVAWPTQTTAVTVASNATAVSSAKTTVSYHATASGTTPPGTYSSYITYVATATF